MNARRYRYAYPSGDEMVAALLRAGSYSALARAIGCQRMALDNYLVNEGLRERCDAALATLARKWPSDDEFVAAMVRLRSLKHVALEAGIPYRTFWAHLYRNPGLKARLDEHSPRSKDPEEQRRKRQEWERDYHEKRPWLRQARRPARRKRILRGDPCAYCGGLGGTVDHIEPVAHGGSDDWTNLTSACFTCNRAKSDTPLLLFMATRSSVRVSMMG